MPPCIGRAATIVLVVTFISMTVVAAPAVHLRTFAQCDRLVNAAGQQLAACDTQQDAGELWIEPKHVHDFNVVTLEPRGAVSVRSANNSVVSVVPAPDGVFHLNGQGLGTASLAITHTTPPTRGVRPHRDHARVRVRGVSPRITVVGWINGDEIDLDTIAPGAGDNVRHLFKSSGMCLFALAQWAAGYRYGIRNQTDADWARAYLVKVSANQEPPQRLTPGYIRTQDYKLLADFRTSRERGRFLAKPLSHAAIIGSTKDPCGTPVGLPGERHRSTHAKQFLTPAAATYVSQTRINKAAQAVERTLSDPAQSPSSTPWIWAKVTVDSKGQARVCTQRFPTYTIYRDGQRQAHRKQSSLATFVKLDHNSQTTGMACP